MQIKPPVIKRLKREVVREIKQIDKGDFVYNVGRKRRFPKVFTASELPIDNIQLIRELYKDAYMTSAEEAIKLMVIASPKKSTIPLYDVVKVYDSLDNFIFGGPHEGVYSGLLRKLAQEGYLSEADIPDVIQAAEHMFLSGYKIVKKNNSYVVLAPDLSQYMELKSIEKNIVKDAFYQESLSTLLKEAPTPIKPAIMLTLSSPSLREKEVFQPPSITTASLVTLSEFMRKHPSVSPVDAEVRAGVSKVILKETKKRVAIVANRGRDYSNYWYTAINALENAILNFFNEEYGFMFVRPFPYVDITGEDGYITARAYLINNRLAEDVVDYFPLGFTHLTETELELLGKEYKKQLIREIADYTLLKFSLGKESISAMEQKVEPATRTIYNFMHGQNPLVDSYKYSVVGDVKRSSGKNLLMSLGDIKEIVERTIEYGEIPHQYKIFFGFENFRFSHESAVIPVADVLDTKKLPQTLFSFAPSWKLNGRMLLDGEVKVYEDFLSRMVDSSGLPTYDKLTMQIKNRMVFLSILARMM